MKKMPERKIETFVFDEDFRIDIVTDDTMYSAYIYHEDYDTKSYMFGMPKDQQTKKEFIEIVEANAPEHIDIYIEEVMHDDECCCCHPADGHHTGKSQFQKLYDRTFRNCKFYLSQGNQYSLANEIGVLRGISYCMECVDEEPEDMVGFAEMIGIQQSLKDKDNGAA